MKKIRLRQAARSFFIVLAVVVSGSFIAMPINAETLTKTTFVVR